MPFVTVKVLVSTVTVNILHFQHTDIGFHCTEVHGGFVGTAHVL